jgi:hypothetical protein
VEADYPACSWRVSKLVDSPAIVKSWVIWCWSSGQRTDWRLRKESKEGGQCVGSDVEGVGAEVSWLLYSDGTMDGGVIKMQGLEHAIGRGQANTSFGLHGLAVSGKQLTGRFNPVHPAASAAGAAGAAASEPQGKLDSFSP